MKSKLYLLIIKLFLAAIPLWLLIIYYVIDDPFKIINEYEEYYTGQSRELFINRDHVSTRLYIKNYPLYHYDSFIFGSSRSFAFLAKEWQKYISSPAFHFDASGESLFGIYTKIKYLYLNKRPLKNCLIIINAGLLGNTFNNEETALIKDPEISGESRFKYHYKFFTSFLTGGFFVPYFAWKAGSIQRLFLDYPPVQKKWFCSIDYTTNDYIYSEQESIISKNKSLYYSPLFKTFFENNSINKADYPCLIGEKQLEMLNEIKRYLNEYGATYKIILYPEPDARSFNTDDFRILQNIFGTDNVFNYTGLNEITANMENYIDDIHARTIVGDKILKDIYSRSNQPAGR